MALMDRSRALLIATAGLFLAAAPTLTANSAEPREPVGVYLHIDIDYMLHQGRVDKKHEHAYIKAELAKLLDTPVLAGVTVGARWSELEPAAPLNCGSLPQCTSYTSGFDWGYLDDVFDAVKSLPGKTVQLLIEPGFNTPTWVKDRLTPCDALFFHSVPPPKPGPNPYASPTVDKNCGSAAFIDFPEQGRADKDKNGDYVLPLPWNEDYQSAWWFFLRALNEHLKNEPRLVAIAIAEPIGASDEIILPTTADGRDVKKGIYSRTKIGGLPADQAWTKLIKNAFPNESPEYSRSDQIFIDLWKMTIDKYEEIFSGLTLFLGPDAGNQMPTFERTSVQPHEDNVLYREDCHNVKPDMIVSCEAKAEIISLFIAAKGPNQKATQVGGMTAASPTDTGNIGIPGVKLLTAPYKDHWTVPQAIGGAEFDHPASHLRDREGCPPKGSNCDVKSAEQAFANVLKVFFNGTRFGPAFGGSATETDKTMYYLEVLLDDVEYMEKHGCESPQGQEPLLLQLSAASDDLFVMAGKPAPKVTLCDHPVLPSPKIPPKPGRRARQRPQ